MFKSFLFWLLLSPNVLATMLYTEPTAPEQVPENYLKVTTTVDPVLGFFYRDSFHQKFVSLNEFPVFWMQATVFHRSMELRWESFVVAVRLSDDEITVKPDIDLAIERVSSLVYDFTLDSSVGTRTVTKTMTGFPEPKSIVLLFLGGLFLIRSGKSC